MNENKIIDLEGRIGDIIMHDIIISGSNINHQS